MNSNKEYEKAYEEARKDLRNEIKDILKGNDVIKIHDYREYDSERCNDGGCYAFHETYTKINNDKWEVKYSTSSDFPYCDVCGSFGNCSCGPEEDYRKLTEEELIDTIEDWSKESDVCIEADGFYIKNEDQIIDASEMAKEIIKENREVDTLLENNEKEENGLDEKFKEIVKDINEDYQLPQEKADKMLGNILDGIKKDDDEMEI